MSGYTMRQLLWDFVTLDMGVIPWLLIALPSACLAAACLDTVFFLNRKDAR